ncbi:hypothetical protein WA158_000794 [Blastocystis sp. Blastoise]
MSLVRERSRYNKPIYSKVDIKKYYDEGFEYKKESLLLMKDFAYEKIYMKLNMYRSLLDQLCAHQRYGIDCLNEKNKAEKDMIQIEDLLKKLEIKLYEQYKNGKLDIQKIKNSLYNTDFYDIVQDTNKNKNSSLSSTMNIFQSNDPFIVKDNNNRNNTIQYNNSNSIQYNNSNSIQYNTNSMNTLPYTASPSPSPSLISISPYNPNVLIQGKVVDDTIPANIKTNAAYSSIISTPPFETCGILGGIYINDDIKITHLIIPKQKGDSDSCTMLNEEDLSIELSNHDIYMLGWIHSHPRQPCFLSSIDIHTTLPFHLLLDKSIAIVIAPFDTKKPSGIFRLCSSQIPFLKSCSQQGHHQHPDNLILYENAENVVYLDEITTVIDMRTI